MQSALPSATDQAVYATQFLEGLATLPGSRAGPSTGKEERGFLAHGSKKAPCQKKVQGWGGVRVGSRGFPGKVPGAADRRDPPQHRFGVPQGGGGGGGGGGGRSIWYGEGDLIGVCLFQTLLGRKPRRMCSFCPQQEQGQLGMKRLQLSEKRLQAVQWDSNTCTIVQDLDILVQKDQKGRSMQPQLLHCSAAHVAGV